MDRSTKATLSTYNTWIHVSRLQKIYHFQSLKLRLTTKPVRVRAVDMRPRPNAKVLQMAKNPPHKTPVFFNRHCLNVCEQIRKTQAEPQWIVAQRLLSALTIPGFT